ncbi:BldC family transcriptional regulator [Nonomuraea wenchangensis]|uniref:BldC family transcriptional regulator n=1 Tax=Nonomuraea wenchangensis TaxID=568860 RepID=UPI003330798E
MSILEEFASQSDPWLTSTEVAILFRVDPKTVMRWAREGRLQAIRTPGGRELRFRESHVREALNNHVATAELAEAVA